MLGDEARITEMGLSASNGKIYVLSSVLTPLVETLVDRVTDQGNSSIMLQALEASGWKKELSTIADTTVVEGISQIRKRYYTLLNVTDETFSAAGIGSLDALRAKLVSLDPAVLLPTAFCANMWHITSCRVPIVSLTSQAVRVR